MPLVGEIALLHLTGCLQKLLKSGADVNVIVDEFNFAEPLFLYIMRTLPTTEDAYDVLEVMLPYANFSLVEDKTSIICNIAFEKRLPFAIVKIMISKGLNLFERDENGRTLRDTIYLNNYKDGKDSLRLKLAFVDQVLIDIALEGDMLMLERLSLNSYDYDQVENRRGQSMIEVVSEKGKEDVLNYLESLPELQRTIRRIHVSIETGNLHEVKQHMINRLATARDKGGRGLLHKAVLFERRFIIKYFLREYPEMVHLKDIGGRTPLHWAVCLKEGKDIEESLMKVGADPSVRDKKGKTPNDYSKIAESMQETINKERMKDFGIEVYLLQRYMDFKFAIEAGDLTKVENIRNSMYKDINLNDLHVKMYQTKPPPKDLLSLSIDCSQDPIGKYLLSQGINWDIQYKHGEIEMSAEKAAEQKEMTHTVEAIQYLQNRAAEEKKILNKVKKEKKEMLEQQKKDGTIFVANVNNKTGRKDSTKENGNGAKNTRETISKINNNSNDSTGDNKSCSCTVI
ncbi:unnamed protein product [Mytilus edulis]|uniref:Uncharacterized protein n=1 Tax=Mytilus edulis TaxID=6550 RepID=A0A8S3THF4_MYTED|nr:unnamed protein product [Mytilus edulis]